MSTIYANKFLGCGYKAQFGLATKLRRFKGCGRTYFIPYTQGLRTSACAQTETFKLFMLH